MFIKIVTALLILCLTACSTNSVWLPSDKAGIQENVNSGDRIRITTKRDDILVVRVKKVNANGIITKKGGLIPYHHIWAIEKVEHQINKVAYAGIAGAASGCLTAVTYITIAGLIAVTGILLHS